MGLFGKKSKKSKVSKGRNYPTPVKYSRRKAGSDRYWRKVHKRGKKID